MTSDNFKPVQPAKRRLVQKQEADILERVFLYGSKEELWLINDFIYAAGAAPYLSETRYPAGLIDLMVDVEREVRGEGASEQSRISRDERELEERQARLYTWHDAEKVTRYIAGGMSDAQISDALMTYQSLRALGAGVQNVLFLHEWVSFLRQFFQARGVNVMTFTFLHKSPSDHCGWFREEMRDTLHKTRSERFIPAGASLERTRAKLPGKVIYRGILKNSDQVSDVQNVNDGIRNTIPIHDVGSQSAFHFFGASEVFGTHLSDQDTIPSRFAKLVYSDGARVLNYGMGGVNFIDVIMRMMSAKVVSGDTIFLALPFCAADSADVHVDLDEYDFFDQSHVTPSGAEKIASALYAFSEPVRHRSLSSSVYAQAERILGIYKNILLRVEVSEYQSEGIENYRAYLKKINDERAPDHREVIGSVAVNCNPITNGHLTLIDYARSKVDHLYVLVIEEDKSAVSFKDRFEMVKLACAEFKNVQVIKGGQFVCTEYIAPEYFVKEDEIDGDVDFGMESFYFGNFIAPALNIKKIFLGEEPICQVTSAYNDHMKAAMPNYDIDLTIIPRTMDAVGEPISASRVRMFIKQKQWSRVKQLVPPQAYGYMRENSIL